MRARQKEIVFVTHGGKRRNAGRKPRGEKPGVVHASRAILSGREPVLVTLKVGKHVSNLRTRRAFEHLVPAFFAARRASRHSKGCEGRGIRLAQFSVQHDHLHLIVEADDRTALSRGVQGLSVRIARALNRMMGRTGKVFADRFHDRVLSTPRQIRAALAYVLCNARKHGRAPRERGWLDPFSSARAFDGWRGISLSPLAATPPVVAPARTWLLAIGWRRGGLIDPDHCPGVMPA